MLWIESGIFPKILDLLLDARPAGYEGVGVSEIRLSDRHLRIRIIRGFRALRWTIGQSTLGSLILSIGFQTGTVKTTTRSDPNYTICVLQIAAVIVVYRMDMLSTLADIPRYISSPCGGRMKLDEMNRAATPGCELRYALV